ncbi:hypothetical protein HMPREF3186_01489 [Gemella haemolysans]|uniref:Uncharacterized protein n=1 Tax=Gemella haemolysans TaxID=1379 RepID=A0A133ZS41_9BACL|nr:hypothetical protein [Gemella haemolysans]KXB58251.1 hypothetical protein HMPREF3186_01489 [Gemella haemolysans]
MDKHLLEKLIVLDRTNIFEELLDVVYSMVPVSEDRVKEIAILINKKSGVELFKNFEYEILIKEFSIISRAIQLNALNSM